MYMCVCMPARIRGGPTTNKLTPDPSTTGERAGEVAVQEMRDEPQRSVVDRGVRVSHARVAPMNEYGSGSQVRLG